MQGISKHKSNLNYRNQQIKINLFEPDIESINTGISQSQFIFTSIEQLTVWPWWFLSENTSMIGKMSYYQQISYKFTHTDSIQIQRNGFHNQRWKRKQDQYLFRKLIEREREREQRPLEKDVKEVAGEGGFATVFGTADESNGRRRSDCIVHDGVCGVGPFLGYVNVRRLGFGF